MAYFELTHFDGKVSLTGSLSAWAIYVLAYFELLYSLWMVNTLSEMW